MSINADAVQQQRKEHRNSMDVGCISGVVGTMFTGALASGARAHIQDMESHMAGLAGMKRGAATCARTHVDLGVVFAREATHGQTWGWRGRSFPF